MGFNDEDPGHSNRESLPTGNTVRRVGPLAFRETRPAALTSLRAMLETTSSQPEPTVARF
jgi:hypothetical protein